MDKQTQNRIALPDLLKGVAVVLMIQVHLTELFAIPVWINSMAGAWSLFLGGPLAAPLFMAVMGFFLAKKNPGLKLAVKRGLQLLVWGLLLNIGLNIHLLIKMATGTLHYDPLQYLFGVDILILAGFSVIIIGIWSVFAKKSILLWLIFLVFFAFGNELIPSSGVENQWWSYVVAFFNGTQSWSYFPVFPWAAYPTAGYLLFIFIEKYLSLLKSDKTLFIIALIFFIPVASGFEKAFSVSINLPDYYHHNGFFVLWTLGFISLLTIIVKLLSGDQPSGKLSLSLQWLGRNVTSIYVFQWIIIGNLATVLYKTLDPLQLLFWFTFVLGMSVFLTTLWKKLSKAR